MATPPEHEQIPQIVALLRYPDGMPQALLAGRNLGKVLVRSAP